MVTVFPRSPLGCEGGRVPTTLYEVGKTTIVQSALWYTYNCRGEEMQQSPIVRLSVNMDRYSFVETGRGDYTIVFCGESLSPENGDESSLL